jgi:NAD+ kinase
VQKHMMLRAKGETALNDIVAKGRRLTGFYICLNGKPVNDLRADGVIIAAPAGSTAYSRSAGGPLLLPESEMIAVTPICANPAAQPLVLDGNSVLHMSADRETVVTWDGEKDFALPKQEILEIRRADAAALIIRTHP